jgi:hypothetical protein
MEISILGLKRAYTLLNVYLIASHLVELSEGQEETFSCSSDYPTMWLDMK